MAKTIHLAPIMKKLKNILFPLLLVVITTLICYLNYTPGTFLTGWDTLHPEFNFGQQFSNVFYGVFRTDQGLGAVAAHSHMSELPRIALLWVMSNFLPLSFLRYAFIFLCFILGPLGIYFFVKHILRTNSQWSIVSGQLSAFLASLVYIFNLGTVQHFYVPFEMFTVQYAALGWLFLLAVKFIQKPDNRTLLIFSIITFLASSMAYASVLWYAYFGAFLLFLSTLFLIKRTKKIFILIVVLVAATLIVNAYWILPNLYFLATAAGNVSEAHTNKLFSDEAFLHNKQYGNIVDTAILKNFLFNWTEQIGLAQSQDLMIFWKNHMANSFTVAIGYIVSIMVILGIAFALLRKNIYGIALIPVFALSLIMIINMNPPFEIVFSYLRENFTLFREGLRFPFTKFSILLMFAGSVFFGIFVFEILARIHKIKDAHLKHVVSAIFVIYACAALIWYGFPMFSGALIDRQMRINIPTEYFELFEYMQARPQDARVAPLPMHTLFGWEHYSWGYQGAGFIWFGLNQPVLARDFDRWNPSNEQYFKEMSTAIYSQDAQKVEALARKYRISYFLLDENVVFPNNKQNALWERETKAIFEKSDNIRLAKQFGNIYLYKVNQDLAGEGFLQAPANITTVGPITTGGFVDLASQQFGDYIATNDIRDGKANYVYPARAIVGRYDRVNQGSISYLGDNFIMNLGNKNGYTLTESWLSNDIYPEFMREFYDLTTEEKGLPFTVDNKQFAYFPIESTPVNLATKLLKAIYCGLNLVDRTVSEVTNEGEFISFTAKYGASCGYIEFPNEKQDFGSILIIEARNRKNLPIRLCVSENITNRCNIYTSLDAGNEWKKYVFMIPPQPTGAQGYAVHFNTVSIGSTESINDVRFVQLIQIPYYRLTNFSLKSDVTNPEKNNLIIKEARQINPTLYEADVVTNGRGLLAFYKAYEAGWGAYEFDGPINFLDRTFPYLRGKKLEDHVLINNWANGWMIEPDSCSNRSAVSCQLSVVISFLPQQLQAAGFMTLFFFLIALLGRMTTAHLRRKKSRHASNQ